MIRNKYIVEVIAFTSYVLFAMAWVAGGTNMTLIMDAMGVTSVASASMLSGAVTIAKIVGTFLAALLAVKVGVKKAFLISGLMVGIGLMTPYSPNYELLLISRFVMGLGGALMVVYFNPIVLQWFEPHERPVVNGLNAVAFNVGTSIVMWLSVDMNAWFGGWQNSLAIVSIASLVLIGLWCLVDFDANRKDAAGGSDSDTPPPASYGYIDGLKDKFCWQFGFTYAGIISFYIGMFTFAAKADISQGSLVMFAGIVGNLCGIVYSRRFPLRVPVVRWSGFVIAASAAGVIFGSSEVVKDVSAFVLGFAIFFPITALFTIPHELPGMTSERITVIFSLFYSISYIVATVALWVFGWIVDHNNGDYVAAFGMLVVLSSSFFWGSFLLPETQKVEEKKAA